MKNCRNGPLAAAIMLSLLAGSAAAQPGIKLLIPSDDTCSALLDALNNGDREELLDLGGWALGYLSGVAQQSGRDILRDTTSESLIDRIAETCQRDPKRALSSVAMEIAQSLLATPPR